MLKEIYVTDITQESSILFRQKLITLCSKFPNEVIKIYIDSHGGDLEALGSMVATMNQVPNEIHTIAIGKAMSAGAFLLSFGDVRYCDKYATIMIHQVQIFDFPDGDIEDLKINEREIKRLNKVWLKFFAENCGITYKDLTNLFKTKGKEIHLTAKQSARFGIVDYAHIPKLSKKELTGIVLHEK
jgi:ATP-dependent Clp protease protease subunit